MSLIRFYLQVLHHATLSGLAGYTVELFDVDGLSPEPWSSVVSDESGLAELSVDGASLRRVRGTEPPELHFVVRQGEVVYADTRAYLRWVPTSDGKDSLTIVPERPIGTREPVETWVVTGRVTDEDGEPIDDAVVELSYEVAATVAIEGGTGLGEASTDEDGRYYIEYELPSFVRRPPTLRVEANQSSEVIASARRCAASPREVIDLAENGEPGRVLRPRFRELWSTLETRALGGNYRNLSDEQLELLACNSDASLPELIDVRDAAKLAHELDGVPAEWFYGWIQAGVGRSTPEIFAQRLPLLEGELERASAARLIGSRPLREASTVRAALLSAGRLALRTSYALGPGASGQTHSLGLLVDTASERLTLERRDAFLDAWLESEDDGPSFWASLSGDFSEGELRTLRFTFDAAQLVGLLPAAVAALQARVDGETLEEDARSLCAWSRSQWESLVDGLPEGSTEAPQLRYPSDTPGETDAERRATYVDSILLRIETRFPMQWARSRVHDDEEDSPLDVFLRAEDNEGFDWNTVRVGHYLAEVPGALDDVDSGDREALVERLYALERARRLSPRWEVVKALEAAGIDSAAQVRRLGSTRFTAAMPSLPASAIREILDRACWVTEASTTLWARHAPNASGLSIASVPNLHLPSATPPVGLADWTTLFGTSDSCRCEHCRSVLGPAAYLADALELLDDVAATPSGTARDELFARRPDLRKLGLDCDNALVPLPYIDLVNEILEVRLGAESWPEAPDPVRTSRPRSELASQPEILYPEAHVAAYTALSEVVFPISLPFDLWREEARVYLRPLGVTREELARLAIARGESPDAWQLAAERLGTTPAMLEVIAGTSTEDEHELWGLPSAGYPASIAQAATFMRQLELSFEELQELLATRSCATLGVAFTEPVGCSLSELSLTGLVGEGPGSPNGTLLNRLLRLRRLFGISLNEASKLFEALGTLDPLDEAKVLRSAAIAELRRRTGLPLDELLAWHAPMDTDGGVAPSLFERVFLSRRAGLPLLPVFVEVLEGSVTSEVTVGEVRRALGAALRLSDLELTLLVGPGDGPLHSAPILPEHADISLATMSLLHRIASFCRSQKLSVADYVRLRALGMPHALEGEAGTVTPENALYTLDWIAELRSLRISAERSDYVFRHVALANSRIPPSSSELRRWLGELEELIAEQLELIVQNEVDLGSSEGRDAARSVLREVVVGWVAERFRLSSEVARVLVSEHVLSDAPRVVTTIMEHPEGGAPAADAFFPEALQPEEPTTEASRLAVLVRIHKAALVLRDLDFDASELAQLYPPAWKTLDPAPPLPRLDFDALPLEPVIADEDAHKLRFATYLRLARLAALRERWPAGREQLFALFADASGLDPADAFERVATGGGYALADVTTLAGEAYHDLSNDSFVDELALLHLERALSRARALGVDAATLLSFANLGAPLPESFDDESVNALTIARSIRATARAQHSEAAWNDLAPRLQDVLRERQRQELSRRLIHVEGMTGLDALHADLLIDPEMAPCTMTSRIVLAHGSVQRLVQRIQLGLEPSMPSTEALGQRWEWMSRYRVWEANRKVFLWPENYLEPDLRTEKTPLFEELERKLLSGPLERSNLEAAYRAYVDGLHELANLEIVATQVEVGNELSFGPPSGTERVLHVFGRSLAPHRYFHRVRRHGAWSPWREIELEISSEHLMPFFMEGRLFLAWASFEDVALPKGRAPAASASGEPVIDGHDQAWWAQESANARAAGDFVRLARALVNHAKLAQLNDARAAAASDSPPTPLEAVLRIHVSERRDELWSAPITSHPVPLGASPRLEEVSFTTSVVGKRVRFECMLRTLGLLSLELRPSSSHWDGASGWLLRDPTGGYASQMPGIITPSDWPAQVRHVRRAGGSIRYQGFRSDAGLRSRVDTNLGAYDAVLLGSSPPGRVGANVVCPRGPEPSPSRSSFVYFDTERSFVVDLLTPLAKGATPSSLPAFAPASARITDLRRVSSSYFVDLFDDSPSALTTLLDAEPPATPSEGSGGLSTWADRDVIGRVLPAHRQVALPVVLTTGEKHRLSSFSHRYVDTFRSLLHSGGIPALLYPADGESSIQYASTNVAPLYEPNLGHVLGVPRDAVDLDLDGAYGLYNWELFFYIPWTIATRLQADGRYDEARRWLHAIFDPTRGLSSSGSPGASRFWRFRPFAENLDLANIQDGLESLSENAYAKELLGLSTGDTAEVQKLSRQIQAWRDSPFDPHRIAAMRPVAYQKAIVMRYLDNLIAWADSLFARDSIESIVEATQLYMLAQSLLGPRPTSLPEPAGKPVHSYGQLDDEGGLDDFGNAYLVEAIVPPPPGGQRGPCGSPATATLVGTMYFCVPDNEKLLGYWDVVEDRLYKIRNCQSIDGLTRSLALFEPPIDPTLLVRAKAMGVDLAGASAGLSSQVPPYRYATVHAKAVELANALSGLGASYLSALEKLDGEALSRLRQEHEIALHDQIRETRQEQLREARASLTVAQRGLEMAQERYDYYSTRDFMNDGEIASLELGLLGHQFTMASQLGHKAAASTYVMPQLTSGGAGIASPVQLVTVGGQQVGASTDSSAQSLGALGQTMGFMASTVGTLAGYQRRQEEWGHQTRLAQREIARSQREIAAAEHRVEVAQRELATVERQRAQAREVESFLRGKFTSTELYGWMQSELAATYYQAYKLALELARRAEVAFRYERAEPATRSFVRFNHWDGLRRGMLAGEQLLADLRRMDVAYHLENRRELELSKWVSLAQHDPDELVRLRELGEADLHLSELDYDRDLAGHYLRRLAAVSLTVECNRGPYDGVYGRLSIGGAETRPAPTTGGLEARGGVVEAISTSTGRDDGGGFDLFRDDRYRPFEGAGAHRERAEGPLFELRLSDGNRFDYRSIDDLVFQIQYTAREGSTHSVEPERTLRRLVRVSSEQSDAWNAYLEGDAERIELSLPLASWSKTRAESLVEITKITAWIWGEQPSAVAVHQGEDEAALTLATTHVGAVSYVAVEPALDLGLDADLALELELSYASPEDRPSDLWLVFEYTVTVPGAS